MPNYPYWDSANRYIVAGPTGRAQTVLAQIFQLPNGWWQVRCLGSRTNCPEKLGPFFGPLSSAQAAIASHCQALHYVTSTGPPVGLPTPEILSINPLSGKINTAFTLTINGLNFASTSLIYFDGASQTGTLFSSSQQLSCPITAAQVSAARSYPVKVVDSSTGSSNTLYFTALTLAAALAAAPPADPTTPSKIIVSHS